MPLILDPNAQIDIALDGDKERDPMPVFVCKALSMRDQLSLGTQIETTLEAKANIEATIQSVVSLLAQYVVGWKNMGEFVFDHSNPSESLLSVLNRGEAVELCYKILTQSRVTSEQKKSSE